jgi:hypothetical protein
MSLEKQARYSGSRNAADVAEARRQNRRYRHRASRELNDENEWIEAK